jgi:small subunit ribosomal protein S18
MAQQKDRQQRRRSGPNAGPIRKKNCWFCRMKIVEVDWKDANQLRRYVSEKGKIRSRRITGACRRHQRQVAVAVKRAREMALLPYVAEGREERPDGRRDRGDRGDRGRDRDR